MFFPEDIDWTYLEIIVNDKYYTGSNYKYNKIKT